MSASRCIGTWLAFLKLGELTQAARETGFCRRTPRKLSPRTFFVTLALAIGSEAKRTIAGMARSAQVLAGIRISRQGFHQRLNDGAARFLKLLYERLQRRFAKMACPRLPGKLARFADVNLVDSTTITLFERLAALFPACRSNVRDAALKIHTCMSLSRKQARKVKITAERVHDSQGGLFGRWVKDRLVLFDLGYFDYGLFRRIVRWGGSFLTRLKDNANGTIVATRRGCAKRRVGTKINRRIYFGPFVDLDVRLGSGDHGPVLRMVGVRDDCGFYHWYVTSLSSADFPAEEITRLYALRWQIELLFKEWKGLCRVTEVGSGNPAAVLCLIYASLCAALLASASMWLAALRYGIPEERMRPSSAPTILLHYVFELARALLAKRRRRIAEVMRQLLESLALHGQRPLGSHAALSTFPCPR